MELFILISCQKCNFNSLIQTQNSPKLMWHVGQNNRKWNVNMPKWFNTNEGDHCIIIFLIALFQMSIYGLESALHCYVTLFRATFQPILYEVKNRLHKIASYFEETSDLFTWPLFIIKCKSKILLSVGMELIFYFV